MSEKEIHFIPKILPIQNAPKRPTVLWELAPNPTQHLVCCLISWWCQIFHWHYLQDEWHLLKERDLASFDTIGFATPPDSNPIDPPPRSYWGESFASIHDPPPTILPWKMIILRRNVWSWRDTGSTELSVILRGNKLNLICKFKLETSGRSEGSTIRSAKSQQKGGLHFTLQKTITVVLYILAICIQVMFSTHVEFSWQNGNLFFCLKNCLGHFRALKPPKRETNMVKTTRATLQHRQIHKSTMIHTQPGRVAAARVCGEQACLPSKATWRKRKIISGPDRGVANHNPCFPKKAANICSWSHEMSHVCK